MFVQFLYRVCFWSNCSTAVLKEMCDDTHVVFQLCSSQWGWFSYLSTETLFCKWSILYFWYVPCNAGQKHTQAWNTYKIHIHKIVYWLRWFFTCRCVNFVLVKLCLSLSRDYDVEDRTHSRVWQYVLVKLCLSLSWDSVLSLVIWYVGSWGKRIVAVRFIAVSNFQYVLGFLHCLWIAFFESCWCLPCDDASWFARSFFLQEHSSC